MIEPRHYRSALAWVALALPAALMIAPAQPVGEGDEPPVRYHLEQGEKRIPVLIDQAFELELGGKKATYTLRADPTRLLDLPALRLQYPRQMPFKYETDGEYTSWTLDGNSALLMVQRLTSPAGIDSVFDEFVGQMKEMFGDGVQRVRPLSMKLDGRQLKGKILDLEIGGTALQVDLVPLCMHNGSAYLLMLQDSLQDNGGMTEEMQEVRRVLQATFKFKRE